MAGINQGTPEVAVGEPLRLGDNGEYEIEHDPVTDRLIVRDTVNGKEAYVRPETNEQIGNQGAFIRSLVSGEPLADDGRLYPTLQEAERAANGWMFVPPGTFNETLDIQTEGLLLVGAGRTSIIDGGTSSWGIQVRADNVTVRNVAPRTTSGGGQNYDAMAARGDYKNILFDSCYITESDRHGIMLDYADRVTISNCFFESGIDEWAVSEIDNHPGNSCTIAGNIIKNPQGGINVLHDDYIVAYNVIDGTSAYDGISINANDTIVIGNRVISVGDVGIDITTGTDNMVANNRVSDSGYGIDINDNATSTTLDANLTGAAN